MNLTWRRSGGARLVLALGSEPRMNIVPGASELAIPFNSLEDALVSQAIRLPYYFIYEMFLAAL